MRWDDPAFGIEWPDDEERTINERDRSWPDFTPATQAHDVELVAGDLVGAARGPPVVEHVQEAAAEGVRGAGGEERDEPPGALASTSPPEPAPGNDSSRRSVIAVRTKPGLIAKTAHAGARPRGGELSVRLTQGRLRRRVAALVGLGRIAA